MRECKGITLMLLIIIILILTILIGVTINTLVNTELIQNAGESKREFDDAGVKQIIDSIYLSEKNKYNNGLITEEQMWTNIKSEISSDDKLKDRTITYVNTNMGLIVNIDENKYELENEICVWRQNGTSCTAGTLTLQVGDFVAYTPNSQNTTYEISNVYSGYGTQSKTYYKKNDLNWRVLGVDKQGRLELISDNVTGENIKFQGYQGYNNGVYLINDMCNKLYGNTRNGTRGRGLTIEDIQNAMNLDVWDYNSFFGSVKYGKIKEYTAARFPTILFQEIGHQVNGQEGVLRKTEQEVLLEQTQEEWENQKETITVKQTYWYNSMQTDGSNFKEPVYYELFMNNEGNYWLASRCVDATSSYAGFGIANVYDGYIGAYEVCYSDSQTFLGGYDIRPVVSLGATVEIDTTNSSKTGTSAATAWVLK